MGGLLSGGGEKEFVGSSFYPHQVTSYQTLVGYELSPEPCGHQRSPRGVRSLKRLQTIPKKPCVKCAKLQELRNGAVVFVKLWWLKLDNDD